MKKKDVVGILAALSTLISAALWGWYSQLPSFDKTDSSFNNINATFQQEVIK